MSDKCGSCDCSDKSQCVKGNSYGMDIIETDKSFAETVFFDGPDPRSCLTMTATENDGTCKCGPSCPCTNCTCGQ